MEFNFDEWATDAKLTPKTIKALKEESLVEEELIRTLSDTDFTESAMLKALALGEKKRLKMAVKMMNPMDKGASKDEVKISKEPVSTKSLMHDVDLEQQLRDYEKDEDKINFLLRSAGLGLGDENARGVRNTGKPKYIQDYVTSVFHVEGTSEERELFPGSNIYYKKDTFRKPKPHEVTLPQWISANARIMISMIKDGTLAKDDILEYLEYTIRIGDLAQSHTVSSVMVFDQRARKDQAEGIVPGANRWSYPHYNASQVHLIRRNNLTASGSYTGNRQYNSSTPRPKCIDYNNKKGCDRAKCNFRHLCREKGCDEKHPQYMHPGNDGP